MCDKVLWGIWARTPALSTALLVRKLLNPRLAVFSVEQTIGNQIYRQAGAFYSSRGSSKRRYYFTYFLLYSAHHYSIPNSLTSPKDWRSVKLQERSRNRGQGSK